MASVTRHSALFDLECMIAGTTCSGARGNCEVRVVGDELVVLGYEGATRIADGTIRRHAFEWEGRLPDSSADRTLVFDSRTRTFHKTEAYFWAGADLFASSETRFAIMGRAGTSLVLLDATTGKRVREWQFLDGNRAVLASPRAAKWWWFNR